MNQAVSPLRLMRWLFFLIVTELLIWVTLGEPLAFNGKFKIGESTSPSCSVQKENRIILLGGKGKLYRDPQPKDWSPILRLPLKIFDRKVCAYLEQYGEGEIEFAELGLNADHSGTSILLNSGSGCLQIKKNGEYLPKDPIDALKLVVQINTENEGELCAYATVYSELVDPKHLYAIYFVILLLAFQLTQLFEYLFPFPKTMFEKMNCKPCSGGLEPLPNDRVGEYLKEISEWQLCHPEPVEGRHSSDMLRRAQHDNISRTFKFQDFKEALVFVNRVGELAEAEGHHPDIHIHWNRVTLELWTHVAKGLTENDFILAAKIDALLPYIQEQEDGDGEKGSDA